MPKNACERYCSCHRFWPPLVSVTYFLRFRRWKGIELKGSKVCFDPAPVSPVYRFWWFPWVQMEDSDDIRLCQSKEETAGGFRMEAWGFWWAFLYEKCGVLPGDVRDSEGGLWTQPLRCCDLRRGLCETGASLTRGCAWEGGHGPTLPVESAGWWGENNRVKWPEGNAVVAPSNHSRLTHIWMKKIYVVQGQTKKHTHRADSFIVKTYKWVARKNTHTHWVLLKL